MSIRVFLHPYFADIVKGIQTVEAEGETLVQVIDDIEKKYPGFKAEVVDNTGKFYGFLEIYVNGNAVLPEETGMRVNDEDEIAIVTLAGGG